MNIVCFLRTVKPRTAKRTKLYGLKRKEML